MDVCGVGYDGERASMRSLRLGIIGVAVLHNSIIAEAWASFETVKHPVGGRRRLSQSGESPRRHTVPQNV
jgi:hypothetical protein